MLKKLCLLPLLFGHILFAQTFYGNNPLAHTYSIVARDSVSGEIGVAVQSHWFSVGSLVSWAEAGVGAIATQSFVNPNFGPQGLALLKTGLPAPKVLEALIASDEGRNVRQLAVIDAQGQVAAFTGENCIPDAGHIVGEQFSVQANLMANDQVWPAMAKAYRQAEGPLAERMMSALTAAQDAGGDIRGKQSVAMLVVAPEASGQPWVDRRVDLRIEDHPEPIKEMQRLLQVHRAYEHMNKGDLAVEKGAVDEALKEYAAAESLFPQNEEMKFWHAVSLVNAGRLADALPIFSEVFAKNRDWAKLTPRLVPVGLLKVDDLGLRQILAQ